MEWISVCDIRYNPQDGREYLIYLDDGGMELAAYDAEYKKFVQIHYGEVYSEDDVQFIALLTNPWQELRKFSYDKPE